MYPVQGGIALRGSVREFLPGTTGEHTGKELLHRSSSSPTPINRSLARGGTGFAGGTITSSYSCQGIRDTLLELRIHSTYICVNPSRVNWKHIFVARSGNYVICGNRRGRVDVWENFLLRLLCDWDENWKIQQRH